MIYINKPLCKNLQNIKLESVVYVSAIEMDISGSMHKKKYIFPALP